MTRPTVGQILTAVALVLASWFIGDLLGAAAALIAIGAVYAGFPARRLPLVGLALLLVAALAWLVGNATRWGIVSFDLVTQNPWPGRFGLAAVVMLLVGVALDLGPAPRSPDRKAPAAMEKDVDERT